MSAGTRVSLHTLGCPKNDADSGTLARRLRALGATIADDPVDATHIVVNTCGFIRDAKEESIAAILEAVGSYPGQEVLVMGCLVERYRDELAREIPEVAGWFRLGEVDALVERLAAEGRAEGSREEGAEVERRSPWAAPRCTRTPMSRSPTAATTAVRSAPSPPSKGPTRPYRSV